MKFQKTIYQNIARTLLCLVALGAVSVLASCYEPSPLYGTFSDNQGNSISLMDDGTYSAKIVDSTGVKKNYEGTYTVLENIITFSTSSGGSINSEWDIRGNMLYITWTDDTGATLNLTLYKTA